MHMGGKVYGTLYMCFIVCCSFQIPYILQSISAEKIARSINKF